MYVLNEDKALVTEKTSVKTPLDAYKETLSDIYFKSTLFIDVLL